MRTVRLAVAGDIHLGKRQYNSPQREKDFTDAWFWVCSTVAAANPDFFILTGDLFDKKIIGPPVLSPAVAGLSTLRRSVVLAVEGNHDGRSYIHRGRSWLEYLVSDGHIDHILRVNNTYHDGGLFFCGSPWAGRKTGRAFSGITWDAEHGANDGDTKIGVIHAAPESYVPGAGGIPIEMIENSGLDLVLMGHCHRSFNIDNKVFCGGSPETCDIGEIDEPGGVWIIDIDLDTKERHTEFIECKPRPFVRREVPGWILSTPGYAIPPRPHAEHPVWKPVVIVDVAGRRVNIDTAKLADAMKAEYDPILVRINDKMDAKINVTKESGPKSFRQSVEPLLHDASFGEFDKVFGCYERQSPPGDVLAMLGVYGDK